MRFIEDSDDDDDDDDDDDVDDSDDDDYGNYVPTLLQNDYVDQFRYTNNIEMGGEFITDAYIISISTRCTRLQSLDLKSYELTDASIISISTHCTGLKSLDISWCRKIRC